MFNTVYEVIMFSCLYEGAMVTASQWKHMKPEDNQLQEHWETVAGRFIFTQEYGNQTYEEKLRTLVFTKFYLGGKEGVSRDNIQAMNDLYTDSYFAAPNTEAVRLHAAAPAPVYNYLLTYRGSSSFSEFFAAGDPEAVKVRDPANTGSISKDVFRQGAEYQVFLGVILMFLAFFHSKIWAKFHFGTFKLYD